MKCKECSHYSPEIVGHECARTSTHVGADDDACEIMRLRRIEKAHDKDCRNHGGLYNSGAAILAGLGPDGNEVTEERKF